MKYVIKNCDNYTNLDKDWTCRSTIQNRKGCYCCKDITDCIMKRIVDECDSNVSKVLYEGETSKLKFVEGNPLAKKILELFEMEEMEEVDD